MPFITQGKTNWRFIVLVIILAIIVGGGALWYAKRPEQPYQLVEIKKTENITDWKTYRNEKYGIEIKYPSIYQVSEEFYDYGFSRIAYFSYADNPLFFLFSQMMGAPIYKLA
jgi:hypothetical protein